MLKHELRPDKVYFEVTNYCNFHCDFCPIGISQRPKQHMDFSLFTKGIEEIASEEITGTIGFHILGEPLMYPHINEAIAYAKSKGLRTEMNTNGSLLSTERALSLAEAGLDELTVSVQMLGEAEHACRDTALSFTNYYMRIMQALKAIRAAESPMELVFCFMSKSTKRYFDIDKQMRFQWNPQGEKQKLHAYILDINQAIGGSLTSDRVAEVISKMDFNRPQVLRLDERAKVYVHPFADWGNAFTNRPVHPAKIGFCGYALQNVGILSNGEVTICCPDYDGHTSLGNLNSGSLAAMLASEPAKAVREGFKKNRISNSYCQHCLGSTNRLKAVAKGLASIYLFKRLQFHPTAVAETAL